MTENEVGNALTTERLDNCIKLLEKTNAKLDNWTDKIDLRCYKTNEKFDIRVDNMLSKNTGKWAIGIFVLLYISIFGTLGYNQVQISQNQSSIYYNHEIIKEFKNNIENKYNKIETDYWKLFDEINNNYINDKEH